MPLQLQNISKIYGKFYNPNRLLSYGKVLNFTIGSRSIGKSTGWAIFMLKDWIDNGHQFIYVRRTQDETQLTAPSYFDNAVNILNANGYNIKKFEYKGGQYFCDGKLCGYAIPLSLQQKYKSSNYSLVWWILYDEFMIAPGSSARYIGGSTNASAEVDAMTSLYQTVDRGIGRAFRNETRIIFVGNAGTFFNPFFINYGIDRHLRPDTKYLSPKNDIYVVELTKETEATKEIKESYGYKMSTEKTRAYAYDNSYADLKDTDFIAKEPKGRRQPLCNLMYENNTYGVYCYNDEGFIYIGHRPCAGRPNIALTTIDHRPNYLMIKNWHNHPITTLIKQMYDMSNIRFADHKSKMVIDFYLAYDV